jgi:DNA-binding MarR family transcriptional regulator
VAKSRAKTHAFLADDEYEAWNALLLLNRLTLQELDAALRTAHGISVSEFDVLITLFNTEGRQLRMSALAEQVMLSPAGLTHLVTRLERDGLVRRQADPTDGRKWFTALTDLGDDRLREARVTHNEVLRRRVFAVTSPAERRVLQRLWRRLQPQPSG